MEHYVADKDIVDSIKLEASCLLPYRDANLREIVKDISGVVVNTYGHYMPDDTKVKLLGLHERVIISEFETFKSLYQTWGNHNEDLKAAGITTFLGNAIFIPNPEELAADGWSTMSDIIKSEWLKRGYSEKEATYKIADQQFTTILFHEIMHLSHNPHLSKLYVEFAIPYYYQTVMQAFGDDTDIRGIIEKMQAGIYEGFIEYAEALNINAHHVFFGLEQDGQKISTMMQDFRSFVEEVVSHTQTK